MNNIKIMSGLREIIINLGTEFELSKRIIINDFHVYVNNLEQRIDVSYEIQWLTINGDVFKKETSSYTLKETEDKQYLTQWDNLVGDIIEEGIKSYFS